MEMDKPRNQEPTDAHVNIRLIYLLNIYNYYIIIRVNRMGRKKIKNRVFSRPMSFSYKETDRFDLRQGSVDALTIMDGIDEISDRERITRSKVIMKALAEYWENHAPGNSQTELISYTNGGTQTLNQLVGQLRQRFKQRGRTTRREILKVLIEENVKGTERISICQGLIKWLKDQGVEVS